MLAEPGDGRTGGGEHAALPGDPRGPAARAAAALRPRSGGLRAARSRRAPARAWYVVERRPECDKQGGRQEPLRAGGEGAGARGGGSRRSGGAAADAPARWPRWGWPGAPGRSLLASSRCARRSRAGSAAVLVAASDGAADGRRKLRRLAPDMPLIVAFSSVELGAALGRDSVVHVAVAPGGLAQRLLQDVERLAGFRAAALVPPGAVGPIESTETKDTTGAR